MAEAHLLISEEEFTCSVCLDTLTDPVSTPCGHSFCLKCLKGFWDHSQVCICPQCRRTYVPRPELQRNTLLNEVIKKLKKNSLDSPPLSQNYDHKLTDPGLEVFCQTNNLCICMICVATEHRGHHIVELKTTIWFTGPAFLYKHHDNQQETSVFFELVNPEKDAEIRQTVTNCATHIQGKEGLTTNRFKRFSTWDSLVRAIALLIHIARSYKAAQNITECRGWHYCFKPHTPDELSQASDTIIKSVQTEAYMKELKFLDNGKTVDKNSSLFKLNPKVDEGLIKIGGRLRNAQLESGEKYPLILPRQHHISVLLVRYYHERVKHQGVAYKGMSRKGDGVYRFGFNDKSWSLLWSDSQYSVYHNSQQTVLSAPYSPRIGVYLDWPAGSLSFYSVSHTMTLLHRFNTSFTEPLYPGFGLGWNTSVKICI
uniref:Uncharacterized protein n=1 Tax=Erpetoichthys calabaricus TaxID=27687 RepID=A0A8C4T9H1_ERPCA